MDGVKLVIKTYLRLTTLREFDKCSLHIFFFYLNNNHEKEDSEIETVSVVDDDNEKEIRKVFLNF